MAQLLDPPSAERDERLNVLLVEDDGDDYVLTRMVLRQGFGRDSIAVDWTTSASDAVEKLTSAPYDVILVDYYLGPSTGAEFAERLRRDVTTETPILMLTGLDDTGAELAAMRAGACDYVVKQDMTPASLRQAIDRALQRKRHPSNAPRSISGSTA